MKFEPSPFSRRYRAALRTHLEDGAQATLASAHGLGAQALAAGLQSLDLARLHEEILITELLPACTARKRDAFIKQAGIFFAAAITPLEETQRSPRETTARLKQFVETLSQRTVQLAACNLDLSVEVAQRRAAEEGLRKKERHYAEVLKESAQMQEHLRRLSRQILTAQENERREISRELHDIVAQTLAGINVRLATLKKEAALNGDSLERGITRTQQLVETSVSIVHRFARDLRPPVLDDLGLIPALHSFMKGFTERTGVLTRLTAFAGVEELNIERRTVLFRVAQEALTNVGRHAQASRVEVSIRKLAREICMQIADDGKSFQVQRVLLARGRKRLGLLGMRERMEMIGGQFDVESAAGKGTTILARLPLAKSPAPKTAKAAKLAARRKS